MGPAPLGLARLSDLNPANKVKMTKSSVAQVRLCKAVVTLMSESTSTSALQTYSFNAKEAVLEPADNTNNSIDPDYDQHGGVPNRVRRKFQVWWSPVSPECLSIKLQPGESMQWR
jgi:hypothetical protein